MDSLITRLQEAETGSRELDAEVAKHLGGAVRWSHSSGVTRYQVMWLHEVDHITQGMDPDNLPDVPEFTTSLDALVALMEEKLPSSPPRYAQPVYVNNDPVREKGHYEVRVQIKRRFDLYTAQHRSEALAFIIAILRALKIEGTKRQESENG